MYVVGSGALRRSVAAVADAGRVAVATLTRHRPYTVLRTMHHSADIGSRTGAGGDRLRSRQPTVDATPVDAVSDGRGACRADASRPSERWGWT